MHKLEKIRKERNLSRKDLVKLSGISMNTIERIERPHTNSWKTNVGVAYALASSLDLLVSDLFDSLELSHLGRPPHTGKPITHRATGQIVASNVTPIRKEHACKDCFLIIPTGYASCELCGGTNLVVIAA